MVFNLDDAAGFGVGALWEHLAKHFGRAGWQHDDWVAGGQSIRFRDQQSAMLAKLSWPPGCGPIADGADPAAH